MPVRKIPKNYRNVTGIAAHRKADGGQAGFESTLERDFITLLEFSTEVERFDVQPVTLEWADSDGKSHAYTPDALVFFSGHKGVRRSPMLYEVKYRSELRKDWPLLRPKFKAAVRFAKTQGWRFKIVTETEIRTPWLENARFLLPFVHRGPQDESHMDLLAEKLEDLREADPESLVKAAYRDEWNQARLLPTLWYLIGTFQIGADLEQPLTMKSRIWSLT